MKIKSIRIKNFRVYSSKQTFNFYNKDKAADFVAIYAPNGFGKTSFIDAIEWSFTDKIERINNNSNLKSLLDNEKRVFKENDNNLCILRNMNNPQEKANVKIESDEDEVLEVESKEFKGIKKCDYNIDSKSNVNRNIINLGIGFKELDEKDFKVNNIITSDMINSFLQIDKPTERFDILHKFWDKDDEYNFYKKILDIFKLLKEKRKTIEDNIKNKNKEIKKYKDCDAKLIILNDLINKYNLLVEKEEVKLLDKERINKYPINQFNDISIKIKKMGNEIEEDLVKLQYLLDKKISYENTVKLVGAISKNKYRLEKVFNSFIDIERINKDIINKKQEINNIDSLCEKYKYIISKSDYYLNIIIENNKLNSEIDTFNLQIKNKRDERRNHLNNLSVIEKEYLSNQNEFNEILYKYQFSKEIYGEYLNNIKKVDYIKKINNNFNITESKYIDITVKLKAYMDTVHKINNNLDKKSIVYELEKYKVNDEISKLIDQSNKLINEYNQNKEIMKSLTDNNDNLQEKKQQLNRFLEISFSFIDENITDTCPLCNSKFDDYEALKKAIVLNLDCDFIDKEFEKIKSKKDQLSNRNKKINSNIQLLLNKIKKLENIYFIRFEFESNKLNSIKEKQKLVSAKLAKILTRQREINNYAGDLEVIEWVKDIENTMNKYNDLYLQQQFNSYNKIIKLKNEVEKIEQEVNEMLLTIQRDKECISCNNNSDILKIRETLEALSINLKDNKDKNYIKDNMSRKLQEKEILVQEKEKKLYELSKNKMITFGCKKEDIEGTLIQIKDIVKEKEESLDKYKEIYRVLVKTEGDINVSLIEEKLRSLRVKKDNNGEKLILINLILNSIDVIRDTKQEVLLEEEYNKLLDQRRNINRKISEVDAIRKQCEEYLNKKITEAFNLDTINSIYQMIDPHPDLQNIKFVPEFDELSTKIHIHAFNSQKELAPVLYFSSAQISILALSIFFAQVLKNTSKLNTIFLDDPIQHLDSINTLAFIDLMRIMITQKNINKQIILTTNNNEFFELLKLKLNPKYYNSKFITLESYGEIKEE
ncbi:MAG: AAA family ATPase [Clostridium butyricum]